MYHSVGKIRWSSCFSIVPFLPALWLCGLQPLAIPWPGGHSHVTWAVTWSRRGDSHFTHLASWPPKSGNTTLRNLSKVCLSFIVNKTSLTSVKHSVSPWNQSFLWYTHWQLKTELNANFKKEEEEEKEKSREREIKIPCIHIQSLYQHVYTICRHVFFQIVWKTLPKYFGEVSQAFLHPTYRQNIREFKNIKFLKGSQVINLWVWNLVLLIS